MLRFLEVGEGRKHDNRIKESILTENSMLPPLLLSGKDHKPNIVEEIGPRTRQSVTEGPNVQVSDLTAKVLNQVSDINESKTQCPSTESLQAKVEALNQRLIEKALNGVKDNRCLVIGSLDFEAWVLNMLAKNVGKIVRKRLEKTVAKIKVDDIELATFLFVIMNKEEVKQEKFEDILPTLKDPSQPKPKLTDQILTGSKDFRTGNKSVINPPRRKPTNEEKKSMIAIAFAWIIGKVNESK